MTERNRGISAWFSTAVALLAQAVGAGPAWAQDPLSPGADVVFLYDNSASMWSKFALIDSTGTDTTFYTALGCVVSNPPAGTPFTYTTAIGPRSIQLLASPPACTEKAGDPYFARASVMAHAIDYLTANYPNSTAGACAFGQDTSHCRPPLPLSMPGNAELVKGSLVMDSMPNTFYVPPLGLATRWLYDSSLTHAARKAIVFISDGQPNDDAVLTKWLNQHTGIPIYCIALGDSAADFSRMEDMSARTGGRYFRIDPRNVPRMNQTVQGIIDAIAMSATTSLGRGRTASPPLRGIGDYGLDPDVPWLLRLPGKAFDLRGRAQ